MWIRVTAPLVIPSHELPAAEGEGWVWVTSVHESRWHAVARATSNRSLAVVCGHRVRGPVHRRLAPPAPGEEGETRVACRGCLYTIGSLELQVERWPMEDPEPAWPSDDPDATRTRFPG